MLSASVVGFYSRYDVILGDLDAKQYYNAHTRDKSQTMGGEFEMRAQPWRPLSLFGALTYNHFFDDDIRWRARAPSLMMRIGARIESDDGIKGAVFYALNGPPPGSDYVRSQNPTDNPNPGAFAHLLMVRVGVNPARYFALQNWPDVDVGVVGNNLLSSQTWNNNGLNWTLPEHQPRTLLLEAKMTL